ncbi:transposase [Fulvivirga sp. M361]|nr:transposase [Fulvivirga sp. M361]
MKKSRYTETQIIKILTEHENGRKLGDLCREYGISQATFYNWKSKYGGMDANQLKRVKELESKLAQYKKMYAELAHDNYILKDVIEKSFKAC